MLDMILLLHTTGEILIDRYGIVSDENNTDVMCYTYIYYIIILKLLLLLASNNNSKTERVRHCFSS
jgi:hypothetical protein